MANVRQRAPTDDSARSAKKAKLAGGSSGSSFRSSSDLALPSSDEIKAHAAEYARAVPYKYAAIGGLIKDDLLEAVVEESWTFGTRGEPSSRQGWGWEQKETDIYKIQQTPDLASLDPEHLPDETLASLPQITRLKDALYSPEFRQFVREVTGCGPLSGKKTDGSVGLYTQGSHLLLHDDSISTRLVSYILYLPNSPSSLPSSSHDSLQPSASGAFTKGWDPAWGGALELYPVEGGAEVGVPGVKRLGKVDVKWGQIVFFEVRPGRSYHAVEEVVVGDGRQRLGVSGWFHRPVEGEEGYVVADPKTSNAALSSLAQITAAPSLPLVSYDAPPPPGLKPSDITFLAPFLAPSYLTPSTLEKLSGQFVEASEIVLHNFLHPDLAAALKAETRVIDEAEHVPGIPPPETGEQQPGWALQGPTSKHRYLSLSKDGEGSTSTSTSTPTPTLARILRELLPSAPFRAWLSVVSSLVPLAHRVEARRFRRGLDYTLASGEEAGGEPRLDVMLGATWWADVEPGSDEEEALLEHGGWEAYLGAPEEGEDPAVFQSKHAKRAAEDGQEEDAEAAANGVERGEESAPSKAGEDAPSAVSPAKTNGAGASTSTSNGNGNGNGDGAAGPKITMGGQELEFDPDQFSDGDFDTDSEDGDGDEDDGTLLTQGVSFNRLLIVLRDPGVMRFVKYLSAGARGARWDVGGEWEVGMMEAEADGEGDEEA